MSSGRRRVAWIASLAGVVTLVAGGLWVYETRWVWPKRFAAVEDGRLYRSGDVWPGQLARLKETYGIRTILSLNNPEVLETQQERDAALALGIRWLNVPLTGDGASTRPDRERIKAILFDENGPMLVHCSAGVNRTGLAVGMYRLHRQGWSLDDVLREMRAFDFEDEPHHENLRQALAEEARIAAESRGAPSSP